MKILVLGAGLSGASLARILTERGHNVHVVEASHELGGLAQTQVYTDGTLYEPYGQHYFHTNKREVWEFVSHYTAWGLYRHKKGIIIEGTLYPYPLTTSDALKIVAIGVGRVKRPLAPSNGSWLKTEAEARFGYVLYRKFIENYSRKMWGQYYSTLNSADIMSRLELRDTEDYLFPDRYQGIPSFGYSRLTERMLQGIPISFGRAPRGKFDLVANTGTISHQLPYRSMSFKLQSIVSSAWDNSSYGVINLPDHPEYVRKVNYNIIHSVDPVFGNVLVQYHTPCDPGYGCPPMYPVSSPESERAFQAILACTVKNNVCPAGRLGLFCYLNMDQAIFASMKLVPIIETFNNMTVEERINAINDVRNLARRT